MPSNPPVSIIASPEFLRRLKLLAKRYCQVRSDLQPILDNLQLGIFPGEQIQGTSYTVLKLRIRNSDAQKGKSGGYRLIYQIVNPIEVRLVLIYSKSEQANVLADEITPIIELMNKKRPNP
jgi:mRNA-degrading endonuclease RelE of RelBE toxin-antitoxin system